MNEPLIRMEKIEYEVVQYVLPSENQIKMQRNTYVAMTMLARLRIKALMSHLLTQIQHSPSNRYKPEFLHKMFDFWR